MRANAFCGAALLDDITSANTFSVVVVRDQLGRNFRIDSGLNSKGLTEHNPPCSRVPFSLFRVVPLNEGTTFVVTEQTTALAMEAHSCPQVCGYPFAAKFIKLNLATRFDDLRLLFSTNNLVRTPRLPNKYVQDMHVQNFPSRFP
jgi:hypothetical protein